MTYNVVADQNDPRIVHYVKLEDGGGARCETDTPTSCGCTRRGWWWWTKLVVGVIFIGALAAVLMKWGIPFVMNKEIIPIMNWEMETFSPTMIALIIFGSVTIFPSILLPSSPSMWVAGMTFGYGYGFLLIFGAVAIGVSIPYFIGFLFYHKIQVLLDRYPKEASIIRLAGEGGLFNQFRAVALIRMSPFPYIIYNYCAVATDVKYGPYLFGTLVGMVPEIFVTLYTGILIKTLAEATHDRHSLSARQIILNVGCFCLTASTTAIVTLYAKKRLKKLPLEEEKLLLK